MCLGKPIPLTFLPEDRPPPGRHELRVSAFTVTDESTDGVEAVAKNEVSAGYPGEIIETYFGNRTRKRRVQSRNDLNDQLAILDRRWRHWSIDLKIRDAG